MRRTFLVIAGLVVLVAAACGDDDGGSPFDAGGDGGGGGDAASITEWCNQSDAFDDADIDPIESPEEAAAALDELRDIADSAPTDELRDATNTVLDTFERVIDNADSIDDDDIEGALGLLDDLLTPEMIEAGATIEAACGDGSGSLDEVDGEDPTGLGDVDPDELSSLLDDFDAEALQDAFGDVDQATLESLLGFAAGDLDEFDASEFEGLLEDLDLSALEEALGDIDLGDLDDFDLGDFDPSALASSEFVDAYQECFNDLQAQEPGDNSSCDTLYDECDDGNYAACNDLYLSANVGSEYEEFGATCGGRVSENDFASSGLCEELGR